ALRAGDPATGRLAFGAGELLLLGPRALWSGRGPGGRGGRALPSWFRFGLGAFCPVQLRGVIGPRGVRSLRRPRRRGRRAVPRAILGFAPLLRHGSASASSP